MAWIPRNHFGMGISSLAFRILILLLLPLNYAARATDADIPRMQAEANKGSISREIELGAAYFIGRGVQQDEKLAAYWYEKAANAGDPHAQKQIGYFYQAGIGVPRDPVRAAQWYERAVAGGLVSAKVNLGVAYLWGLGVPKNMAFGAELFRQAVQKGSGLGADYLGDMYYFGIGTQPDIPAAEHWYSIGAKLHDPRAEFRLAGLLSNGQGDKHDPAKAAELLRESSNAGYIPAKHALGLLLANHPELTTSPHEGVDLLQASAAAGTWKSSAALGILARDGRGLPMDPKDAYFHFRVAVLQGGEVARKVVANDLSILSTKITEKEMGALDQEAAAWSKTHPLSLDFIYKDGVDLKEFPAFALATANNEIHAGLLIPAPSTTDDVPSVTGAISPGAKNSPTID
jgi:TPR repeat protein